MALKLVMKVRRRTVIPLVFPSCLLKSNLCEILVPVRNWGQPDLRDFSSTVRLSAKRELNAVRGTSRPDCRTARYGFDDTPRHAAAREESADFARRASSKLEAEYHILANGVVPSW